MLKDLPDGSSWTVDSFTTAFVSKLKSYPLYVFSLYLSAHGTDLVISFREKSSHVTSLNLHVLNDHT